MTAKTNKTLQQASKALLKTLVYLESAMCRPDVTEKDGKKLDALMETIQDCMNKVGNMRQSN